MTLFEKIYPRALAAGENKLYAEDLAIRLTQVPALMDELLAWMDHGTVPGEFKSCGLSVMDIMVWQIDHARIKPGGDPRLLQNNPDRMVLSAFDALLRINRDPERYLKDFAPETELYLRDFAPETEHKYA